MVTVLTEHQADTVQMSRMGHGDLKRRRDLLHSAIVLRVGSVAIDRVTQTHVARLSVVSGAVSVPVTILEVLESLRVSGEVTEVLSSAVRDALPHLSRHGDGRIWIYQQRIGNYNLDLKQ